ncbi:alpha/beta hydrolase [Chryseolinea soli]|uniref:Alpha/beta hydrolase n=1 Tax=Chryseolinea soli TaxID=2321403 RepID=A0A385SL25_9BACT|nr:alpha/beta hydrolase [Chryseolinea soli]AYB29728.1 alpha/beta hydrolase [Chryseolinea soli]
MRFLLNTAVFLVLAYLLVVLLAFLLQKKLLFYPTRLPCDFKFRTDRRHEEVFLNTSDGEKIDGLFFSAPSDKVILCFHGNAGSLEDWQFVCDDFDSTGFNFFVVDYRGYGKSTGNISEAGFYKDAQAAYDFLLARGFEADHIVVYGRSIGSGVAVHLATHRQIAALILESPYISVEKLATEKYRYLFPTLYLRYHFDNLSRINAVKAPLLVIHGRRDDLIPFPHGQALYDAFDGKKQLIAVDGGHHNDLSRSPQFLPGILSFLRANVAR